MADNKGKILLVDDEVDLTTLTQMKLESEGYECVVLNESANAFQVVKDESPDVVILDIMMPEVTGFELCRRIRRDPITYQVPILIFSALGQEPEILHGLEQGADGYMVKPFDPAKLTETVEGLMDLAQAIERKNPLTNLPETEAVKRDIIHRLARNEPLAVSCVSVTDFVHYRRAKEKEVAEKVISDLGRDIKAVIQERQIYESFPAHMGGEHFLIVTLAKDYKIFSDELIRRFEKRIPSYFKPDEVDRGYFIAPTRQKERAQHPLLALAIGVVHNEVRKFKGVARIFEALAQVKHVAEVSGPNKVFADRRRSER